VAGTGSLAGATLLELTNNTVSPSAEGWYFNLATYSNATTQTDTGERVVVTPAALFNSNTVVISTLIPGTSNPCNPSTTGSILFVNASTGSPGSVGVTSLGGFPYVGAEVNNVRTSGTLPVTTPVGGGAAVLPGVTISGTNPAKPLTGNAPIWRRRSWSILLNDQ
jgi:type IV pilus assembly protein PilY1